MLNKDVGSPLEVVFLLSGHLIRLLLLAVCKAFPGKAFGRSWFLLKYLFFFTWIVAREKILTMDNLWRPHICLVEWCCMCMNSVETTDPNHLLHHCAYVHNLWSLVFCTFGLHWAMPRRVVDLLECWKGGFGLHCAADLWGAICLCVMWALWQEQKLAYFLGD